MEEINNSFKTINLRSRKRIFKNTLKLEIVYVPESEDKVESDLYNEKVKINEDLFFLNFSDLKFNLYVFIGCVCLAIIFFFTEIYFLSAIVTLLGLLYISYNYLVKNNKKLILDRNKNLLQYPDFFLKSPIVTKFENTVAILGGSGSYGALILKLRQTSFFTNYHINNFAPLKYWSFMVWYMDKNRPLPPGNAFDEYRERDFQRRKAEGFPSPLYPSFVPTPEATPEQQAERDKYWEERFTIDENGETLRHFWERDRSLKVDTSQYN